METFLREEPNLTDKTGDTTSGEGAAGESKKEDFVTGVVVVSEEGIAFSYGIAEAFASCACEKSVMHP
jgi:hypothetical protein